MGYHVGGTVITEKSAHFFNKTTQVLFVATTTEALFSVYVLLLKSMYTTLNTKAIFFFHL